MPIKAWKTNSVAKDWLVSYICIMLIPILIGSTIYMEAMNTLKNEIIRSNEGVMQQVQETIDRRLQEIDRLTTEISLNKQLETLILASSPLNDDEQYLLLMMMKDLRTMKLLNDFVDHAFIYFKNSDKVLSPTSVESSQSFFSRYRRENGTDWPPRFQARHTQIYMPGVQEKGAADGTSAVLYARSLVPDYPDRPGAVLMLLINDAKFLSGIRNIPSVRDGYVMILDGGENVVAKTGATAGQTGAIRYHQLTEKSGMRFSGSSADDLAISYTTSSVTGWKYVFVTPIGVFADRLDYLKRLTFGIVALCLLIGGLCMHFFLRRNYGPMHLLLNQASKQFGRSWGRDDNANEYAFIQATLDKLAAEKKRMGLELREQRPAMKANLLVQLLRGRTHRKVPVAEALAALDIRFQPGNYAVLLITIENLGKLDAPSDEERYSECLQLVQFILTNVTEELAGQKHHAYAVNIEQQLVCIVNGDAGEREEWISEELVGIAENVKMFMWQHLNIHLTIAISARKSDLLDLPQAYEEALEASEYKAIMGGGEIIAYEAIRQEQGEESMLAYYYPLSGEQKLINLIISGDAEGAKSLADDTIRHNLSRQGLSVRLVKCLMAEFTGTLLKAMIEIRHNGRQPEELLEARIGQLMHCRSIKELKAELFDLLERMCVSNESGKNAVADEVKQFVIDNYRDPNLNINVIGDAFHITPSYLARQFKHHTGEALLEYVQRTRIEEAKRRLIGSVDSIQEIAKVTGFNEITTFNRTFKKFEGITPGKYREMREGGQP